MSDTLPGIGLTGDYADGSDGWGASMNANLALLARATHPTPDMAPAAPSAQDDEFDAGALDPKWAWLNQGAATIAFGQGALSMAIPADGGPTSGRVQCILSQAVQGGTWKYRAKISALLNGQFNTAAIYVYSASPFYVSHGLGYHGNYGEPCVFMGSGASLNGGSANDLGHYALGDSGHTPGWYYFEVEFDGVTLFFRFSKSGIEGSFYTLYSAKPGDLLGGPVTQVGIGGSSIAYDGLPLTAFFDWFRKVA